MGERTCLTDGGPSRLGSFDSAFEPGTEDPGLKFKNLNDSGRSYHSRAYEKENKQVWKI